MYEPASQDEADYLASYATTVQQFPRTEVTVDAILFDTATQSVLLIKRGGYPFRGWYALPGGFANPNETLLDAIRREVREEVNLDLDPWQLWPIGVADTPGRDPRGRVISHMFVGGFDSTLTPPTAGDDAASFELIRLDDLDAYLGVEIPVAFDHYAWIKVARTRFPIDSYAPKAN